MTMIKDIKDIMLIVNEQKSQVQTLELKNIIFEILKNNWMGITAYWRRQNKNQLI